VSINRTIKALGVAKSTIYYKAKVYPDRRRTPRKNLTQQAKASILLITGMKATYGTPRVRTILKRDYNISLSKYMVHRFMKEEGLLITRNRTRGSSRPHTGKIAVNQPNTRWASDITSIKCWNGQKIRFTYILDCCDRSIIAWKAGFHMQACDIEMMLQEAIFNRFGDRLPEKGALQFLHDNGPDLPIRPNQMVCVKLLMELLKGIMFMKAVWIIQTLFINRYKNGWMSTIITPHIQL